MIPKIAHFVWLGSVMPKSGQANVARFKELHPDWNIMVWPQYPDDLTPELQGLLRKIPSPKHRSEIIRLWILHCHGGVYLDHDLYLLRPIDALLEHSAFVSLGQHGREVAPCIIGATADSMTTQKLLDTLFQSQSLQPYCFGRRMFTALRRSAAIVMKFLPEHYFCAFRVGSMASAFIRKPEEERAKDLERMWARIPKGSPMFGVHTWGDESWTIPAPPSRPVPVLVETGQEATLGQKVTNFMGAMARVGKSLVTGQKVTVPPEEYERRLAICKACQFFKKGRCVKCGCVMSLKTRLRTEHCPIHLW